MKNLFVFLGAPGSGKGSLSELLINKLGFVQFSTGNACRKHIAEGTELGKKIDFSIKSGKLVPDDVISEMVEDWLQGDADQGSAIILDGFPRTVAQAKYLQEFFKKNPNYNLKLIEFKVPDKTVILRLSNRLICGNKKCQAVFSELESSRMTPKIIGKCDLCGSGLVKRADDAEDVIKKRLSTYHEHMNNLIEFYSVNGITAIVLDATKSLEEIYKDFQKILNDYNQE